MRNLIRYFTLRKRIKAKIRECESKIIDMINTDNIRNLTSDGYIQCQANNHDNAIRIETLKEML
jgi:hypothetical protein